jgi:hypothetical protein
MIVKSATARIWKKTCDLIRHNKKAYIATDFPNATGNTTRPKGLFLE